MSIDRIYILEEMGLARVKQENENDKYSFLLNFWGIYCKIDFESEKYRKTFGGQRFLGNNDS